MGSLMRLTKENALDYIIECGKILEENNTSEDMWIILPSYKRPRSKKWRIQKKKMKLAYFGLYRRDFV